MARICDLVPAYRIASGFGAMDEDVQGTSVAIISRNSQLAQELAAALERRGLVVKTFRTADETGTGFVPHVVVVDLSDIGIDGFRIARRRNHMLSFIALGRSCYVACLRKAFTGGS